MAKLARLARMPRLSKLINVNRFKNILKAFEKKETDDSTLLGQYMTLPMIYRIIKATYLLDTPKKCSSPQSNENAKAFDQLIGESHNDN